MTVKAYAYQADIWCPECCAEAMEHIMHKGYLIKSLGSVGPETTEEYLDRIAKPFFGIDRAEEHTYDSGQFPKVILKVAWEDGTTYACTSCQEEL